MTTGVTDGVPDGAFVHFAPTPITSGLTRRTIWLNEHAAALAILPSVAPSHVAAAGRAWHGHVAAVRRRQQEAIATRGYYYLAGLRSDLLDVAERVVSAVDGPGLGRALGALHHLMQTAAAVNGAPTRRRDGTDYNGVLARATELLVTLWRHHVVAFPMGRVWTASDLFGRLPSPETFDYGPMGEVIRALKVSGARFAAGPVHRLVLAVGGAEHVGDLDQAYFTALRPHVKTATRSYTRPDTGRGPRKHPPRGLGTITSAIPVLQRAAFAETPGLLARVPQSYRSDADPPDLGRSDPAFGWATRHGPRLAAWRAAAAAHVAALRARARVGAVIDGLNFLLDYVAAGDDVPADPLDYCRVSYTPTCPFLEYVAESLGTTTSAHFYRRADTALQFFRGVLRSRRDDPAYRQPIDREQYQGRSDGGLGKTFRTALPLRFVRMMIDILEERPRAEDGAVLPGSLPTYRWARGRASDHFRTRDPVTGEWVKVWSPVLATYMLIRLHLPLRGYQVRMLDSGEGDPEVYRPGGPDGSWVPNTSPLAPARERSTRKLPPQGFARRIHDRGAGTTLTGLYVNTNKTADRGGAWEAAGYEIPWEHDEVLRLFAELRDWQERYNPISAPMRRDRLHDPNLRASADVAKRLRPVHFLMRDPCMSRHPHEPLTDGRVKGFWLDLLDELERRLDAHGIAGKDGQKVALITQRTADGRAAASEYDLHSLRVTGLTHYSQYVPISILSAFVAGHASTVQTYYYVRPHAAQIHDALRAAREMHLRNDVEQTEFAAWQRDVPLKALADAVVYNDVAAVGQLREAGAAVAAWMEYGVCPAGGTLCHVGGPVLLKRGERDGVYSPVPGGPRNCALCRFHVTGPAWLGGLAAKYNATMSELHDAITRLRTLEGAQREAEARAGTNLWAAERWASPAVRRAEAAVETQQGEVTTLLETLGALGRQIEESKRIQRERGARGDGEGRHALVTTGSRADVEYALELRPTTLYDMWDRVCASSEWHPSIDARMPAVHRGRLYDRMLKLNGQPVIFATLTPEEAVAAGNAMSRWLRTTLGEDDVDAVIAGRRLLAEVGLSATAAPTVAGAADRDVLRTADRADRRLTARVPDAGGDGA